MLTRCRGKVDALTDGVRSRLDVFNPDLTLLLAAATISDET
jgi:hypothetical protein